MKIGLIDVDGHNFPNLALMKIAGWHKQQGDMTEWAFAFNEYDRIYKSKVFTFTPDDLTLGLQHTFIPWFMWMSIIKSLFFAFIISSVSSFYGYTVDGGSVEVGKASTNAVVSSSVLILFSDVFLTQILS